MENSCVNLESLYNMTALLYYKFIESNENDSLSFLRKNLTEIYEKSNECSYDYCGVEKYFTSINKDIEDNNINIDSDAFFYSDAFKFKCFVFLNLMDNFSSNSVIKYLQDDGEDSCSSLNTQYTNMIMIFPTYTGVSRYSNTSDRLASFFNHLVFFCSYPYDMKNYAIDNYYIRNLMPDVKIAFVNFPYKENFFEKNDGKIFKEDKKEKLDQADIEYIGCIEDLMERKEVDIIFGPEMHGSEKLNDILYTCCGQKKFRIIFCPSCHTIKTGKRNNIAKLFISSSMHIYEKEVIKNYPATIGNAKKGKYIVEDIEVENKKIVLVHINGIGRIAFLICKDYINLEIENIVKSLNVDVFIVQCFTKTLDVFKNKMKNHANLKSCSIIGNSKSADSIEEFLYCYRGKDKEPFFVEKKVDGDMKSVCSIYKVKLGVAIENDEQYYYIEEI